MLSIYYSPCYSSSYAPYTGPRVIWCVTLHISFHHSFSMGPWKWSSEENDALDQWPVSLTEQNGFYPLLLLSCVNNSFVQFQMRWLQKILEVAATMCVCTYLSIYLSLYIYMHINIYMYIKSSILLLLIFIT
jgi:hypothetical protein